MSIGANLDNGQFGKSVITSFTLNLFLSNNLAIVIVMRSAPPTCPETKNNTLLFSLLKYILFVFYMLQ